MNSFEYFRILYGIVIIAAGFYGLSFALRFAGLFFTILLKKEFANVFAGYYNCHYSHPISLGATVKKGRSMNINRPNVIYAYSQSSLVLEGYNLLRDQKSSTVLAESPSTERMISGAMLSVPKWLPFASEVYKISASLKDFVLVPVNIMFSDIPNRNGVAFPYRELTRFDPGIGMLAYQSWRGKPGFVEHNNRDHSIAAGIILDATLQKANNYQGNFYKVVLLLAWDRSRDPILANAILNKERAYSMGAHCSSFRCSICGSNVQKDPCDHAVLGKPEFKIVNGELAYLECIDFLGSSVLVLVHLLFSRLLTPNGLLYKKEKFDVDKARCSHTFIDLTGQKFGRLKVLNRVENNKHNQAQWRCLCECGNKIISRGNGLRTGNTQSCGCLQKERAGEFCRTREYKEKIVKDLTGKEFGKLTVIKRAPNIRGRTVWHCRCKCGKTKDVLENNLKTGNSISCGCLTNQKRIERNKSKWVDLKGKQFGRLKVLRYNGNYAWECICTCKNKIVVKSGDLKRGFTKSCGCLCCEEHSLPEKEVCKFVKDLLGIDDLVCLNKKLKIKGARYRPDIFIPSLKLIIEFNGLFWHSAITGSENDDPRRHVDRSLVFAQMGYRTIFLWDDDWQKRQFALKNYLRSILQPKSLPIYDARKLQIINITQKQANQGLEKYHPQGIAYSKNEWLALTTKQGKIVACMGFSAKSRPVLLQKNTVELTRYCSKGRVRGGASRLLTHYCRAHPEISQVLSYSDNDYFDGKMYSVIGFKFMGDVPPDYSTIWNQQRRHKSFTKRSNLVKLARQGLLKFDLEKMTEKSCLAFNRIRRAWNSGKSVGFIIIHFFQAVNPEFFTLLENEDRLWFIAENLNIDRG